MCWRFSLPFSNKLLSCILLFSGQGDDVAFVRNGALYAPGASIRLGQVHMPQGVRKFNVYRDQELSTGGMLSVTIPRGPNMPSDPVSGSHGTQCLSQQSSVSQGSMGNTCLVWLTRKWRDVVG